MCETGRGVGEEGKLAAPTADDLKYRLLLSDLHSSWLLLLSLQT